MRIVRIITVSSLTLASLAPGACSRRPSDSTSSAVVRPGGALTVSTHGEPRTFNRFVAHDPQTVLIVFPSAFAPGLRLLDNLPILPKHKLEAGLKAGNFPSAWGLKTPPEEIVGLGPFVVSQYVPGQRLIVSRNPHYWRKDASGTALPYLDRVTIEVITEQDPEMLRLESGQLDAIAAELRPEDYAPLKRAADAGRVKLLDLGVAYDADMLWFNLKPGAFKSDPRAAWLQRDELRRAISMAVDREAFANTVFLGAAVPIF